MGGFGFAGSGSGVFEADVTICIIDGREGTWRNSRVGGFRSWEKMLAMVLRKPSRELFSREVVEAVVEMELEEAMLLMLAREAIDGVLRWR